MDIYKYIYGKICSQGIEARLLSKIQILKAYKAVTLTKN